MSWIVAPAISTKILANLLTDLAKLTNVSFEMGKAGSVRAGYALMSDSYLGYDAKTETSKEIFQTEIELPIFQLTEEQRLALKKEYLKLLKVLANQKRQLEDETFTSKAPAKVIDSMRGKLAEYEAELAKLEEQIGEDFSTRKTAYYDLFKTAASQKRQLDNKRFVNEAQAGEMEALRASFAENEARLKEIEATILG